MKTKILALSSVFTLFLGTANVAVSQEALEGPRAYFQGFGGVNPIGFGKTSLNSHKTDIMNLGGGVGLGGAYTSAVTEGFFAGGGLDVSGEMASIKAIGKSKDGKSKDDEVKPSISSMNVVLYPHLLVEGCIGEYGSVGLGIGPDIKFPVLMKKAVAAEKDAKAEVTKGLSVLEAGLGVFLGYSDSANIVSTGLKFSWGFMDKVGKKENTEAANLRTALKLEDKAGVYTRSIALLVKLNYLPFIMG